LHLKRDKYISGNWKEKKNENTECKKSKQCEQTS